MFLKKGSNLFKLFLWRNDSIAHESILLGYSRRTRVAAHASIPLGYSRGAQRPNGIRATRPVGIDTPVGVGLKKRKTDGL